MFLAFLENAGYWEVGAHLMYILSVIMFMLAIMRMSKVKTARSGNWLAMGAMFLAMAGQFIEQMQLDPEVAPEFVQSLDTDKDNKVSRAEYVSHFRDPLRDANREFNEIDSNHDGYIDSVGVESVKDFNWLWISIGLGLGTIVGLVVALRVKMTQMPEMVGLLNGSGGFASMLVGIAAFAMAAPEMDTTQGVAYTLADTPGVGWFNGLNMVLTIIVGAITFTGSVLAFGKLSEWVNKKVSLAQPKLIPGRHLINAFLFLGAMTLGVCMVWVAGGKAFGILAIILISIMALLLGFMLVLAIGGGDMPVVISLLNSYSGVAAALSGFTINSPVLVVAGSLVGASGIILTMIMCKAMNRSLVNVIFGGFGAIDTSAAKKDDGYKNVKSADAEEVAMVLADAQSCIMVPGYGMAVAQAQHAVRELADFLTARGCKVRYAIHPVAGRMPGHMNVLLAEANVPYDQLYEMDAINSDFKNTDVAIVIGANDVVNPAAKDNKSSPLYGMPVLNVEEARSVFVIKRSLGAGFAGVKNELFEKENVRMLYADGRKACEDLIKALKEA
ncbi:MAG: NAD(P)(+) transhydrogenase (Re/Si-specific) subunit beta [Planctomycetes bacterium]|nr:NAD(P)(+) transhydrogenase (Re/Si-specific) subunit beta [Planctomycetota bacterium]